MEIYLFKNGRLLLCENTFQSQPKRFCTAVDQFRFNLFRTWNILRAGYGLGDSIVLSFIYFRVSSQT